MLPHKALLLLLCSVKHSSKSLLIIQFWSVCGLSSYLKSILKYVFLLYFYFQVKLLLEMLVKKCGLDAVKAVMPEEHMKLLTNIRKVCQIMSC